MREREWVWERVAQPGEGRGEKTNFVADAERVFERGDLMISMIPTLEKTFRSFGKMNSIPTAGLFKQVFRQRNRRVVRSSFNVREPAW